MELLERVSNTVEFFGGVTFRVIMFQLLCYRLHRCVNAISSTGTEESGSAVSLFTDPLFSFQRSSNARFRIKTAGDCYGV